MKNLISLFILSVILLFTSCSTSNDVVSSRAIQKRKYTRGYLVDIKQKAEKPT